MIQHTAPSAPGILSWLHVEGVLFLHCMLAAFTKSTYHSLYTVSVAIPVHIQAYILVKLNFVSLHNNVFCMSLSAKGMCVSCTPHVLNVIWHVSLLLRAYS